MPGLCAKFSLFLGAVLYGDVGEDITLCGGGAFAFVKPQLGYYLYSHMCSVIL